MMVAVITESPRHEHVSLSLANQVQLRKEA
jgi:hypothetical protein